MQKLYKTAFKRILTKIGSDKLDTFTLSSLQTLLKEKGVPLSEIDETIFHKIPRQEVKNFVRNPCPINNASQTTSQIVTNAKAVRGALNIVEKKICFRCPFVASCDKAFIEPPTDFKISNPLENLLISMKQMSEVQQNEKIRNRTWFSGVRVCDSLNSVMDDLLQGGEQFKTFKAERNSWKEEAEAQKEKQQLDEKQVLKTAKQSKVPLKDVYAQIPTSNKVQKEGENGGEEMFEQLSKGPENIFKKKKGDEFIKIAQKYLNEETQKPNNKKSDRKQKRQKRQYDDEQQNDEPRRPQKRQYQEEKNPRFERKNRDERQTRDESEPKFKNMRRDNQRQDRQYERKEYSTQRRQSFRKQTESQGNYEKSSNYRNRSENNKYNRGEKQGYQRKRSFRDEQERENPKIRRLSKERSNQAYGQKNSYESDNRPSKTGNRLDKFYSDMKEERSEQEEILAQLNRKEYKPRESKLPKDAKFNSEESGKKQRKQRQFSEKEMDQFDRMEKIPKILKTQFASKQDIQDRVQQEKAATEEVSQRKGRRVRRQ